MADWQFGDVLEHAGSHGHTRIMFVGRKRPIERKPDGAIVHWGFVGLTLEPMCPGCTEYCHDPVGKVWAAFGGDPDSSMRGDAWCVVDRVAP